MVYVRMEADCKMSEIEFEQLRMQLRSLFFILEFGGISLRGRNVFKTVAALKRASSTV